jgi:centrosomal CEP192-like protein
LAASSSCSVTVTFKPSTAGGRQGFLTVSSTTQSVSNTPITATASLTGTGLTSAALTTTPTQLTFSATAIGQVSTTQLVTVKNSGQSGITDLELTATAGFGVDLTKTTCTATLAGGGSCTAGVLFAPAAAGTITGSLTASSLLSGAAPATTALTGTGAQPAGIVTSPESLVQFGTTGVGQIAQPVPVTITNQGTVAALTGLNLAIDAMGTGNGFGLSGSTCDGTLAGSQSCAVNVTFKPTQAGTLSGTLTISSSNGGSPASLQLTGIGFDFQLTIAGTNSATVTQGQTAYYTLDLTTLGGSTGTAGSDFSFQCSNLPTNAVCVFNPAQLAVLPTNVTGNVSVGIATGGPVTTSQERRSHWQGKTLLLCSVLALPLGWRRRGFRLRILLLSVLLIAMMSSCTSSSVSGGELHLGGGTPTGTYTISITAIADGVQHSSQVTLVVN